MPALQGTLSIIHFKEVVDEGIFGLAKITRGADIWALLPEKGIRLVGPLVTDVIFTLCSTER